MEDLTEKINNTESRIDKRLQLPIGKKFIYENNIIKVIKRNSNKCNNCFFNTLKCNICSHIACCNNERTYKTEVYFKKIK